MSKRSLKNKKLLHQFRRERAFIRTVSRIGKYHAERTSRNRSLNFQVNRDTEILKKIRESFFQDLEPFIEIGSSDLIIEIPSEFTICEEYSQSIKAIKRFATSLYEYAGKQLTLDFSNCTKADTPALFLLQIIRLEFLERLHILQNKLTVLTVIPDIRIKPPLNKDVIRLLMVSGFAIDKDTIDKMEGESTLQPINAMGYFKGTKSQKHYQENKKGLYSSKVVNYLDSCLKLHQYTLTHDEKEEIDGIIGEILNNAEDHSGKNNWFMTANFSKELFDTGDEEVGELNLTIMNFGNTIYEAFLNTSDDNLNTYSQVLNYVENIRSQKEGMKFSEEELFVLATMQDQVSRLKYEEESRGTGTMRFINSFLKLRDFENKRKNFSPNLSIFSGNVHLKCDNDYKPFSKENVFCLSLNPEMNLKYPPSASHLKRVKEKFQGTLLSVKIYINKAHYDKKYGGI